MKQISVYELAQRLAIYEISRYLNEDKSKEFKNEVENLIKDKLPLFSDKTDFQPVLYYEKSDPQNDIIFTFKHEFDGKIEHFEAHIEACLYKPNGFSIEIYGKNINGIKETFKDAWEQVFKK